MIKAHTITVEAKSRDAVEKLMAKEFNKWTENNPFCEVFHIFEPVRKDKTYGDHNYNTYHSAFTFFFKLPSGFVEVE